MTTQTRHRPRNGRRRTEVSIRSNSRDGATEYRESLRDLVPKPGGLLLVGMCTVAQIAKGGHYLTGTYGRRVWKKLAASGLHEVTPNRADDECWAARGNGVTDLVKRALRSNDSLKRGEVVAGVAELRKKVRRWRPRAILFAFKNAAGCAIGARGLEPGALAAFECLPTFLLTGPYAKPEAAAQEAAQLSKLRS